MSSVNVASDRHTTHSLKPSSRRVLMLLILLLALFWLSSVAACPNCKNSLLESGDVESARMREGYYWSYIMMSSMPFISLSTLAGVVLYHSRRRKKLSSVNGN